MKKFIDVIYNMNNKIWTTCENKTEAKEKLSPILTKSSRFIKIGTGKPVCTNRNGK